jgi:hypothetical protein
MTFDELFAIGDTLFDFLFAEGVGQNASAPRFAPRGFALGGLKFGRTAAERAKARDCIGIQLGQVVERESTVTTEARSAADDS